MSIYPRRTYWTAEEDRQLRILWGAGWSTISIGVKLGRGKNAICGRRRRLGLPERGSPIAVELCAEKVFRFRREIAAGMDAAREELARAA